MKYPVNFTLNGVPVEAYVKPTETLLDVIREHLNIKSPKRGCDSGDCGTCTVLLNGQPIRSCLTIALTMNGKQITTVEGLTVQGKLNPIQEAFHEKYAAQCGFCTPGMVLAAKALLDKTPNPSDEEIKNALSGHICRCGTYVEAIEAIKLVAQGQGKE